MKVNCFYPALPGEPQTAVAEAPISAETTNEMAGHQLTLESKLECGPMPNVMAALWHIGGSLCSMAQSLADAHY